MTFLPIVKDGTGAGRKKPLREKPERWTCRCVTHEETVTVGGIVREGSGTYRSYLTNPGWLTRCMDCGTERSG